MAQELRLLGGEGNATAVLVAGTVTNVAVVTLPSAAGYEFDVSIAVALKMASAVIPNAVAQIGSRNFAIAGGGTGAVSVIGDLYSFPYVRSGNATFVTELASSSGSSMASAENSQATHTFKAAPGQAITCPIISNAADTYFLHYTYIGRKIVNNSF